jgi:hypothetical protein
MSKIYIRKIKQYGSKKIKKRQTGGSSNSRIEDNRPDNLKSFSVARIHDPTDLVLEVGQKYVFARYLINENIPAVLMPFNLNYEYEELQYLGQKQNRVYYDLNAEERFDKRRDKRERQLAPQPDGTNLEFQKQHAFRRLNGTGEVLMLLDHQVLDQIVF